MHQLKLYRTIKHPLSLFGLFITHRSYRYLYTTGIGTKTEYDFDFISDNNDNFVTYAPAQLLVRLNDEYKGYNSLLTNITFEIASYTNVKVRILGHKMTSGRVGEECWWLQRLLENIIEWQFLLLRWDGLMTVWPPPGKMDFISSVSESNEQCF